MTDPQKSRPTLALNQLSKEFPGIWKHTERLNQLIHQKDNQKCPDWCFLPEGAAAQAIVSSLPNERLLSQLSVARENMARVAALATWRMTKGVYRFDPDVLDALRS